MLAVAGDGCLVRANRGAIELLIELSLLTLITGVVSSFSSGPGLLGCASVEGSGTGI